LVVLHVDPDSRLRVLFPLDPSDDSFIRGGQKYQVLGRGHRESFEVDVRSGRGTVYAAVSAEPFRFDGFVVGDHWDLRALNDVAITRDTEADLNELVRRWATTDFDYDIVAYDVYEHVYASGYSSSDAYSAPTYYSSAWDPYYYGGTSFFVGIGFGAPYFYSPYRPFYPYGYYPYSYYPYGYHYSYYYPYAYSPYRPYYPYSYYYPTYYYPYRPYYPYGGYGYGYGAPYRNRAYGTYNAGGYYFGGHYAAPWRNRGNDRFYSSAYAWRGREATTDLATAGRFSTGYRGRGFERGDVGGTSGARPTGVSPRRRNDGPAPNVTPVRTEGRRPAVVMTSPSRSPEARPARDRGTRDRGTGRSGDRSAMRGDRNGIASHPMPVRVGAGADGSPEPRRAEPRRSEEIRGPSNVRDYAERNSDDRRLGYDSGVIPGRREVEARGPETRGPSRSREMVDDGPGRRSDVGRYAGPEARRESPDVRERPTFEPRPMPRAEPRSEPGRAEAPSRMDGPRAAPRPQAAPRGGHGGGYRGGYGGGRGRPGPRG
jgi:hypothetical protein